ncbi:hypothetical protein HYW17_00860 [Candidatus Uhrbacteria bacterium]|nr:hypothetical protein [Candidatus Uhrbacteria bacterium]
MLDPQQLLKMLVDVDWLSATQEEQLQGLLDKIQASVQSMAVNNFRSSKVRPMYYINGRPYGARIKTGSDFIAHLQDKIIDAVESPAGQEVIMAKSGNKPLTFKAYINLLNQQLADELAKVEFGLMVAEFLYAGYCAVDRQYEVCVATFRVDKADEKGKCAVVFEVSDRANNLIATAGDAEIADTLLTGTSVKTDRLIAGHVCAFADMVVQHVLGLDSLDKRLVNAAKATVIRRLPPVQEDCETLLSKEPFRSAYDRDKDTLPLPHYIKLLEQVSSGVLTRQIKAGKTVNHMQYMSLRELLKIIQFLIETTARVHEYLKDSIPTVGGDIYFATITDTEGFVFRSLEDNF